MDIFRRGRHVGADVEGRAVVLNNSDDSQAEMQDSSAWSFRRPALFTRRRPDSGGVDSNADDTIDAEESPKTPRFNIAVPSLPSNRIQLPWTRRARRTESQSGEARPGTAGSQEPNQSASEGESLPLPAVPSPAVTTGSNQLRAVDSPQSLRSVSGSGHAEERPTGVADGRRRGRGSRQRGQARFGLVRQEYVEPGARPKRFLFCFPWVHSQRMRSLILQCFVSGTFAILLLGIYLALTLTSNIAMSEFTVLLILIILFAAVFFCHSLVRILLFLYRPPREDEQMQGRGMQRLGGYAVPEEPIRVVLARDEEDVEQQESGPGAGKPRPPPYGAWRQSIRVDPDRIFWQRNPNAPSTTDDGSPSASTSTSSSTSRTGPGSGSLPNASGPRPPSYVSEDGVDYVVEARPRSMAPGSLEPRTQTVQAPLPVHPSEAGRWNGQHAPW